MPRNTNYVWLFFPFRLYKCSDLLCSVVPIHFGHVTVHQDEFVGFPTFVGSFDYLYSFKAVASCFNSFFEVELRFFSSCALEYDFQCIYIVRFVVNDKDLVYVNWLCYFTNINFKLYFGCSTSTFFVEHQLR